MICSACTLKKSKKDARHPTAHSLRPPLLSRGRWQVGSRAAWNGMAEARRGGDHTAVEQAGPAGASGCGSRARGSASPPASAHRGEAGGKRVRGWHVRASTWLSRACSCGPRDDFRPLRYSGRAPRPVRLRSRAAPGVWGARGRSSPAPRRERIWTQEHQSV